MRNTISADIPRPTATIADTPTLELQEQIRRRAYELYKQRGGNNGHEIEDWLRAESEVTQQKTKSVVV